jgi:hypothetical protein
LGFNIIKKEPSVTPIPVHLQSNSPYRQYQRNDNSSTMSSLDRYFVRPLGTFHYNGTERNFKELTYSEYFSLFRLAKYDPRQIHNPLYYIEQPNHDGSQPMHVILRSAKFRHFARIRDVPPSRGELFYLRALLQHRPASSFVDARTVDGTIHNTYQEAATAHGLFANENEAEYALQESIRTLKTPRQLRYLFGLLLVNDCIPQPIYIWNTFQQHLCLDFILSHGDIPQIAIDLSLQDLSKSLEEHGKRLSNFGLPEPCTHGHAEIEHEMRRWGQHPEILAAQAESDALKLNTQQRQIYDEALSAVITQSSPSLIFTDGQAGTGKTFLVNVLCNKLRSLNLLVLPTATSGYAAQHYPGGRTTHSAFKVRMSL